MKEIWKCQSCLRELEEPFETERGTCHLCNVKNEAALNKIEKEGEAI